MDSQRRNIFDPPPLPNNINTNNTLGTPPSFQTQLNDTLMGFSLLSNSNDFNNFNSTISGLNTFNNNINSNNNSNNAFDPSNLYGGAQFQLYQQFLANQQLQQQFNYIPSGFQFQQPQMSLNNNNNNNKPLIGNSSPPQQIISPPSSPPLSPANNRVTSTTSPIKTVPIASSPIKTVPIASSPILPIATNNIYDIANNNNNNNNNNFNNNNNNNNHININNDFSFSNNNNNININNNNNNNNINNTVINNNNEEYIKFLLKQKQVEQDLKKFDDFYNALFLEINKDLQPVKAKLDILQNIYLEVKKKENGNILPVEQKPLPNNQKSQQEISLENLIGSYSNLGSKNPYSFDKASTYLNNLSQNSINSNSIGNNNNSNISNNINLSNNINNISNVNKPSTTTSTTSTTSTLNQNNQNQNINITESLPKAPIEYLPIKLSKEEKEKLALELNEKLSTEYEFLSIAAKLHNPISFKIIPEYTKFIVLKAIENDEGDTKLSGSPLVCKMWSIHISMPGRYQEMLDLLGVRSLAYKPQLLKRNKYERTLELLKKYYGNKKNNEIWPSNYLVDQKK